MTMMTLVMGMVTVIMMSGDGHGVRSGVFFYGADARTSQW